MRSTGLQDFLAALGLMLAFEGILYALAPSLLKDMAERMRGVPDNRFRLGGLAALAGGVLLVWLARG